MWNLLLEGHKGPAQEVKPPGYTAAYGPTILFVLGYPYPHCQITPQGWQRLFLPDLLHPPPPALSQAAPLRAVARSPFAALA